ESGSYWLDKVRTSIWRDVRTLAIKEAYTAKYSIHPGADTMLYGFRLTNRWLSMKKDISSCGRYVRLDNQSIERDRLIRIRFVLNFVKFISFTFGDKEMILVIEACAIRPELRLFWSLIFLGALRYAINDWSHDVDNWDIKGACEIFGLNYEDVKVVRLGRISLPHNVKLANEFGAFEKERGLLAGAQTLGQTAKWFKSALAVERTRGNLRLSGYSACGQDGGVQLPRAYVEGMSIELQEHVEPIDLANHSHANIRAKDAEVVSTICQHNPRSQQLVMDANAMEPLLTNFTSDDDVTVRTKTNRSQRLASIYRLQSEQIGGNPSTIRYVRVTPTEHTNMPSPEDKIRLANLLGISNEEAGLKAGISKNDSKETSGILSLQISCVVVRSCSAHLTTFRAHYYMEGVGSESESGGRTTRKELLKYDTFL
ncbi:HSP70 nucleotide exchange factor FES1, partial [Tanacetum coccineum]